MTTPTYQPRPSSPSPLDPGASRWSFRLTWAILAAVTLLRATALGRSLWWDEAYTAWAYVRRGPDTIRLADAYIANNHVLFSWLAWATTTLGGEHEIVLRVWAFVPGTAATIWLLAWVGRRLGWTTAAWVSALLALSPLATMLLIEARGYGLVLLASVGLLVSGVAAIEEGRLRDDVGLAAAALLGVLALPSLAVPAVITGIAVLGHRRRLALRLVLLGGLAALVGFWWYRPLLGPITAGVTGVGARHGTEATLISAFHAPATLLLQPSVEAALSIVPPALASIVVVMAWWWGCALLLRGHPVVGRLIVVLPVGSILVLSLVGFHLLPRYIAFLLPSVVLAGAVALVDVADRLRSSWPRTATVGIGLVALVVAVVQLRPVTTELEPKQQLRAVAELADALQPRSVFLGADDIGWRYYLADHDPQLPASAEVLDRSLCVAEPPVLYVEPATTSGPTLAALEQRGFVSHRFGQRAAPGDQRAWVLESPAAGILPSCQ